MSETSNIQIVDNDSRNDGDKSDGSIGADRSERTTGAASPEVLVTSQPEKFAALANLFLFIEERRIYTILAQVKMLAIIVAVLLSIPIVFYVINYMLINGITSGDWWKLFTSGLVIDIVKFFFVYMMIGLIAMLLAIWRFGPELFQYLKLAEEYADLGRDVTMVYLPHYRGQLKDLNIKIRQQLTGESSIPEMVDIARDMLPMLALLIKRDPNLIKWGVSGLKIFRTLSSFFK